MRRRRRGHRSRVSGEAPRGSSRRRCPQDEPRQTYGLASSAYRAWHGQYAWETAVIKRNRWLGGELMRKGEYKSLKGIYVAPCEKKKGIACPRCRAPMQEIMRIAPLRIEPGLIAVPLSTAIPIASETSIPFHIACMRTGERARQSRSTRQASRQAATFGLGC